MPMTVFHVNTTIKLGQRAPDAGANVHFAFATDQASHVGELQRLLDEDRTVLGLRLVTSQTAGKHRIKAKVWTLLTRGGVAMVSDWTRGELIDEAEESDG